MIFITCWVVVLSLGSCVIGPFLFWPSLWVFCVQTTQQNCSPNDQSYITRTFVRKSLLIMNSQETAFVCLFRIKFLTWKKVKRIWIWYVLGMAFDPTSWWNWKETCVKLKCMNMRLAAGYAFGFRWPKSEFDKRLIALVTKR